MPVKLSIGINIANIWVIKLTFIFVLLFITQYLKDYSKFQLHLSCRFIGNFLGETVISTTVQHFTQKRLVKLTSYLLFIEHWINIDCFLVRIRSIPILLLVALAFSEYRKRTLYTVTNNKFNSFLYIIYLSLNLLTRLDSSLLLQ